MRSLAEARIRQLALDGACDSSSEEGRRNREELSRAWKYYWLGRDFEEAANGRPVFEFELPPSRRLGM